MALYSVLLRLHQDPASSSGVPTLRTWTCWRSPGTPLLWTQAERAGAAQTGEKKVSTRPQSTLQHLMGPQEKRDFSQGHGVVKTRGNVFKLK